MSIPLQSHEKSKIKFSGIYRSNSGDGEKSEASLYSQGRQSEVKSDNLFSSNQTFTNIQHTQKIIQQKANSLNKIKSLEQQLKSCKSRSSLWEKAKLQINNVNKYLKLSSISLGCSDTAIMKQFFQTITELLQAKEGKNNDEKVKAVKMKQKQAQLFQKLVESNKKKYELQQKIVQYQYEISKLNGLNNSLREKSRAQNTESSSKIRQFHEETLMTIQYKQGQLSTLQERYNELKLQVVQYDQKITVLNKQLQEKEQDLVQTKDHNEELYLECQNLKRQIEHLKGLNKSSQQAYFQTKNQLDRFKQQNQFLSNEIKKNKEQIYMMRSVIQDAKATNDEYYRQLEQSLKRQESKRQQKIAILLQKQQALKKGLTNNIRFAINRKRSKKGIKKLVNSFSDLGLHVGKA